MCAMNSTCILATHTLLVWWLCEFINVSMIKKYIGALVCNKFCVCVWMCFRRDSWVGVMCVGDKFNCGIRRWVSRNAMREFGWCLETVTTMTPI